MIYFLQPTDGGPIKIGYTGNLEKRHKELEAHYSRPLAVLATRVGGRDTERDLHKQFSHLRLGLTEQFQPAPELLEFIGRPLLVAANPETVEAMEGKPLNGKPVRLDLTPEVHHMLRVVAAEQGQPMSIFARDVVERTVREMYGSRKGR